MESGWVRSVLPESRVQTYVGDFDFEVDHVAHLALRRGRIRPEFLGNARRELLVRCDLGVGPSLQEVVATRHPQLRLIQLQLNRAFVMKHSSQQWDGARLQKKSHVDAFTTSRRLQKSLRATLSCLGASFQSNNCQGFRVRPRRTTLLVQGHTLTHFSRVNASP